MDFNYILKLTVIILMIMLITKFLMIAASYVRIVEFFEDLWKKIRKYH